MATPSLPPGAAVGRGSGRDPWALLGGVALCAALVGLDVALGADRVLSTTVVIAPFLTALWGTTRQTALVGALAFACFLVSPVWNDYLGAIGYAVRAVVVLAGASFAVISAATRARLLVGRARFALLAEVAEVSEGAPTLEETMRRLTGVVVPAFADVCTVDVVAERGMARVAAGGRGDGAQALEAALGREVADDDGEVIAAPAVRRVVGGGQATLVAGAPAEVAAALARDGAERELLLAAAPASAIVVPLRARGRTLGALGLLLCASAHRPYGDEDLEFARVLSGRAGLALDNAGLFTELETMEARLGAAMGSLAEAVTVQDRRGALVYANDAAAELLGFSSADELLATPPEGIVERFATFTEDGEPLRVEALPGRRVLAGETPDPLVVRAVHRDTGEERWRVVKASAVPGRDGRPQLAVNVVEDITSVKRAELTQRILAEAGEVLAATLEEGEALDRLARLLVPQVADWCSIHVAGPGGLPLAAVAHTDADKVRFAREYRERYPVRLDEPAGPAAVLRSGRPELAEIDDRMLARFARDGEELALLRTLGVRRSLVVPVVASGRPIGALSLVCAESGRAFGEDDIALASELGRRVGTALENARLVRERTRIARTLQSGLLPPRLPTIPGWASASLYRPAGAENWVGGDFYDAFRIRDGWMLVVGDVAGRGPEAASLTAMARYTLRATGRTGDGPVAALTQLNRELLERPATSLCTVACVLLRDGEGDAPGGDIEVVCAGHPQPMLVRGGAVEPVGSFGPLLGAFAEERWEPVAVSMAPGDVLVLYTDGVVDTQGADDRFGEDRLRSVLAGSANADAAVAVLDAALAAFHHGDQDDDTAVLAIQRAPAAVAVPAAGGGSAG